MGDQQRARQRERAAQLGAPRVYILLGPAFFRALDEPDARNIGTPELAVAVRHSAADADGTLGDLARAYAHRLEVDASAWSAAHNPQSTSGLDFFRLYAEIAKTWPVQTRPSKATSRGGSGLDPNADAWTTVTKRGWEKAQFYWELVNGRTRFKLHWGGDTDQRRQARESFRQALEEAALERGEPVSRTRAKSGGYMTALEFSHDARDEVLVDGRVDPARALRLYDRATSVFQRALGLLPPLDDSPDRITAP